MYRWAGRTIFPLHGEKQHGAQTLRVHKVRLALELVIKVISNIVSERVFLLTSTDDGIGLAIKEAVDGVVSERCSKCTSQSR